MATKARLETVITGDDAPFVAAIQRAEQRANTFAGRVQGSLRSAFKRTPDLRAERALSGFGASLASGDIQGALLSVTERLSGLGLAAGVGIGVAVGVLVKAKEQIDAVDKSVEKLNIDLARPVASQGALGPEGISKEIEATNKDLEDLSEKRKGIFQRLREAATAGQPDYFNTTTLKTETPDRVPAALKASQEATKRIMDLTARRVGYEEDLTSIKEASFRGDERTAALAKIELDISAKRADILLKARPRPGTIDPLRSAQAFKEAQEISKQGELDKQSLIRAFDQKKQESEVEGKILALKKQGLTAEEATTAETRLRIALLREELSTTPTEQRQALQNKITALKQSLGPDLRPPIGISGESSLGIVDPMTGEFRHELRPQEQANLRGGAAEAQAKLRDDQSEYASKLTDWNSKYQDYMRGADYYSKEDLIKPTAPSGYDVNVSTGKLTQREAAPGTGPAKPMTKEEFHDVLEELGNKYLAN